MKKIANKGKRIGVVGGTGNIGTSVMQALVKAGYEVTCISRGNKAIEERDIRYIFYDRQDSEKFINAMRNEKFDVAIDLTCFNAFDAKISHQAFKNVEHFIQTSTVCTYGPQIQLPVTETNSINPNIPYGENKAAADDYFMQVFHEEGFPVTILKPSTSYGTQQGLFRQIGKDFSWIDRIRKGKPIIVCDSGMALHQFMHVDDVALAYVSTLSNIKTLGQIYNVVNGVTTWAEFHKTAMDVIGRQTEMISISNANLKTSKNDIPGYELFEDVFQYHSFYSGEKIKRDMPDFQPKVSLEQGISMVLKELDQAGRIPDSDSISWEDDIINHNRWY